MNVLTKTIERIPFVEGQLTAFFPGFEASLNGIKVLAHVDTGGTFLHMGVDRAAQLGIDLTKSSKGRHGAIEVDTYSGIARQFNLGSIEMENVPIVALPSLIGQQDFVIFGTNLLQEFLPTLDYPNKVMVLRPKHQTDNRSDLENYTRDAVAIPFRVLGDHYMIAKGGIGAQKDLNFFIDSGLVSMHPDGKGGVRQAAFVAARNDLETWRIDLSCTLASGAIELSQGLSLGPLTQSNHIILAPDRGILSSMDEEEIHGLLSHAFLKQYAWTIDFEAGNYYFQE